ncbi:SusD/RagB family nutrient-binding outer membrane lipoprotein [Flaviaesturariibacter flavus]|uniref:SusD/RagB family nutrient-binding outer membrane lipoprotein n=1 Tax=Flaviaesturariibacter flavus TaxID=2502780 RepID=A0A4R1BNV4_9BACT|nr:SusD/RagB family nutrient-binding outer membrane lipoprotein [Flaviaesturariibacter flavus]TCJ19283.1 SusD/RagB family nutrient-binding outer membrane lipoprotein [Flaviaesturariibacter flavus]
MKKLSIILAATVLVGATSCKKYLDVNNNVNNPAAVDPALYLPTIESNYALGIQFDARALGTIVQNWANSSTGNSFAPFERHGYIPGSDASGDLWRNVYWKGGMNTVDMINIAREQKKWDIAGAGLALQAWGWQMLTDYHGEIILKQAFDPNRNTFDYDTQDTVYAVVKRLCEESITYLNRNSDGVGTPIFGRFDIMYRGNVTRWKRFVYGLMAINEHHRIKKADYNAAAVIRYVDSSFTGNNDDALVPFDATGSADANFFGTTRQNLANFGQSAFIVRLMDGSRFNGAIDPRRPIMLSASTDGIYRGLAPYTTQASNTATTAVRSLWGTTMGTLPSPASNPGKYLYQDRAPFPLMTYPMLQFIKAEAALKNNDNATALDAYSKGVKAHVDFVGNGATGTGATTLQVAFPFITDPNVAVNYTAAKNAYLADTSVIPTDVTKINISKIMLQKYIALWGYGFIETWVDLRKFDYSADQFPTFALPASLFPDNGGKPAYRMRPRYNSEYAWNVDALTRIGGFNADYQTYKMWIQQ